MSEDKPHNRRKHLRFSLNDLGVGYLDLNPEGEQFEPTLVGLIGDESLKGAKLVFVNAQNLSAGQICKIKVGKLPVLKTKIQWLKDLEGGIRVVGFHYLE